MHRDVVLMNDNKAQLYIDAIKKDATRAHATDLFVFSTIWQRTRQLIQLDQCLTSFDLGCETLLVADQIALMACLPAHGLRHLGLIHSNVTTLYAALAHCTILESLHLMRISAVPAAVRKLDWTYLRPPPIRHLHLVAGIGEGHTEYATILFRILATTLISLTLKPISRAWQRTTLFEVVPMPQLQSITATISAGLYHAFTAGCMPNCRNVRLFVNFLSDNDRVPPDWLSALPIATQSLNLCEISATQACGLVTFLLKDAARLPHLRSAPRFRGLGEASSLELQALKCELRRLCVKRHWSSDQDTLNNDFNILEDLSSHARTRRATQARVRLIMGLRHR